MKKEKIKKEETGSKPARKLPSNRSLFKPLAHEALC